MANPVIARLNASADTYISIGFPNTNFGTDTTFVVGSSRFGLIKFDLSAIPANATINEAILDMTSDSGAASTIVFYRLVRDWVETEATYNIAETGTNWGTAGALNTTTDYNSTSLGTMAFSSAADEKQTLDITATVQNWVDLTNPNYGLKIALSSGSAKLYHSLDAGNNLGAHLFVDYTYPLFDYQLNSNDIDCGVQAWWGEIVTGKKADATQKTNTNWRRHTWDIAFCEMATWEILEPTKGTSFTALRTTGESTPNSVATYATGRVLDVTGQQMGRRMEGVKVNFLVDITS